MESKLMLNVQRIIVNQGSIEFIEFENLKQQAQRLASQIEKVEVDEENIKQSKKLLATVNRRLKELEDRRISIKKTMLEPYQIFEEQVKEIVGIIKVADETVRQQVKYLEEFERLQKEETLKELFEKRIRHYSFRDLFSFKDFLQPKHLNKTVSVKAVEDEMVQFLEKLTNDLKVIRSMPNAEALLSAYVESKDLAAAINHMDEQERRSRQIEASQALNKSKSASKCFLITLFDEKDYKLVEMFMLQNKIKFEAKDVI